MKLIEWINGKTKLNKTTFDEFQNNIKESVVPVGGTTGQVLAKNTDTDNDVKWVDQTGGGVTVVDSLTSTSTTDALSAKQGKILNDKITNINTYSTEEVNTGKKWIDGKDIYRKVITQNNANTIDLANLSIDTLIETRGQVKVTNPSYDICALDFSWTGGDSVLRGIFTQYTGTNLVFNIKNITVGYIHVILEYTKAS